MNNQQDLKFYTISTKYIEYLRDIDDKVPFNKDDKHTRPYVGIIENIKGNDYFIPLTSKNDKKYNSQSSIKMFNVKDSKERIGVLLINNMIPVSQTECREIDIVENIKNDFKYGLLMRKQYAFVNENQERIKEKVSKVYQEVTATGKLNHKQRFLKGLCCDFPKLEEKCQEYGEREQARRMAYMRQMGHER